MFYILCSQTFDTLATLGVPMGFSPTKAFIVQGVGQDLVLVKHRQVHTNTQHNVQIVVIDADSFSRSLNLVTVIPVDSS